jgi:hypothetical protein
MRAAFALILLAAPAGAQLPWSPGPARAERVSRLPDVSSRPADSPGAYAAQHYRDQRRSAKERGTWTRKERARLKNEARFIEHQGE